MKFTCLKEDLQKVLTAAEPITGTKTNFSILTHILFETGEDNALTLQASNMEMTLTAKLDAKIAKHGSIALIQSKLSGIIRELPEGEVLFELKGGNKVVIKSMDKKRNAEVSLLGMPRNDFPEIPAYPAKKDHVTIDKMYFRKMIQKTIFAVSNDNMKYTLNGVYMECTKGSIKMVAIDGRRLALINSPIPKTEHDDFNAIVPQQFLVQLQKSISSDGPLTFCFIENRLHFKVDNLALSTNVLNGKFPNYSMFIPNSHKASFSAKTTEITSAIALASQLVDSESNKMTWELDDNVLKISAQNSEYGESNEPVVIHYQGSAVKIGLNYKLLHEILKQVETEEVEFHFNDGTSPIMIKEKNRGEYFFIIMPMKLD